MKKFYFPFSHSVLNCLYLSEKRLTLSVSGVRKRVRRKTSLVHAICHDSNKTNI